MFRVPFPTYDPDSIVHRELGEAAAHAETIASAVELPQVSFQAQRRKIREALAEDGVATTLDDLVAHLLRVTSHVAP